MKIVLTDRSNKKSDIVVAENINPEFGQLMIALLNQNAIAHFYRPNASESDKYVLMDDDSQLFYGDQS